MKEYFDLKHITEPNNALSFSDIKSGYITLVQTLIHNGDVQKMINVIESLQEADSETQLALYYFHNLIWDLNQYKCTGSEVEVRFTCTMDWKGPVDDFIWNLEIALSKLDNNITFPKKDNYPSTASILYEGVLDDFAAVLAKESIVLDVLDDGSDSYPFILYYYKDEKIVHEAIRKTGLTCGSYD